MTYQYKNKANEIFNLTDATNLTYKTSEKNDGLYKIIWAMDDAISIGIDGYRVMLQKNQLLFATPLNHLDAIINHKSVIVYTFNRAFYCIRDHDEEVSCNGFLFLGSSSPLVVSLNSKEQQSFRLLYAFFIEEFETVDHIQGEMLLVLLKRLLIKSVRIARKSLPDSDMPQGKLDTIRKFNLLVEMHFREKHKVSDYASLLHITPKSISNLFSRYYNTTPLKIINQRLVLESKRLLDFSEQNINEISFNLGFEEVSHFSKFFKTKVGVSPSDYRRRERSL